MKKYSHLVTIEDWSEDRSKRLARTFFSVNEIPSLEEWNNFIEEIGYKNRKNWFVICKIIIDNHA